MGTGAIVVASILGYVFMVMVTAAVISAVATTRKEEVDWWGYNPVGVCAIFWPVYVVVKVVKHIAVSTANGTVSIGERIGAHFVSADKDPPEPSQPDLGPMRNQKCIGCNRSYADSP